MKKSTNQFRRCPNCPHHTTHQQKCCCQRNSAPRKTRPMTSRNKREPSTIDQSAVNTTLPTIVAEFSALRTENNQLKRELLNVSTFLRDQNYPNTSSSDTSLNEKLFLANKNLKEALLEIDNLSKANKQLCERNSRLSEQSEGIKIQLREVEEYLDKYKKKCKKMVKETQALASKEQIDSLRQHNNELQEEVCALKEQIRCLRFQNRNFNMIGALSPQWVAHTGNKGRHQDFQTRCEEEAPRQEIEVWKRSLSETINLLRNESTHLNSVSLQASKVGGLDSLLQRLLQSYSESILSHFQLLMKEIIRKVNNYQKKVNNLASKLENFLLVFRNKRFKRKLQPPFSVLKTDRTPMADLTNRLL